jgi:pantothenate kinase
MPDPVEAHAKRGAHWTFNAEKLVEVLAEMRKNGHGKVPSFDHAAGDTHTHTHTHTHTYKLTQQRRWREKLVDVANCAHVELTHTYTHTAQVKQS